MAQPSPTAPSVPGRILVRGVNWLGDAVMTTPALQRLREHFPRAAITLLVPKKLQDLFQPHPAIDKVIAFEPHETVFTTGRRLRDEQFDLGLVLPNSPRSAVELWLARIPQRIGYARPWRNWFLTRVVPARPGRVRMIKYSEADVRRLIAGKPRTVTAEGETASAVKQEAPSGAAAVEPSHQLYEYLQLVAAVGANSQAVAPALTVTDAEIQAAGQKLVPGWPNPARLLVGLNPGAEYGPAKRWPVENFGAAAREILRRFPEATCLVFGGAGDVQTAETITRLTGGQAVSLAGKTSLRELMALLKACRVLLTNDTGPMHLAAAVGTRLVVPFGSTSPELTGPGLPGDARHTFLRVSPPCTPCFRRTCPIDLRCLTGITVDKVAEAVAATIAG